MNSQWSKSRLPSLSATNLFFRKQLWIWPLLAAILLATLAWWVRGSVETTLSNALVAQLQTILNADLAALDIWFASQKSTAEGVASDPGVRAQVTALIDAAHGVPADDLRDKLAEPIRKIRAEMQPYLDSHDYQGFILVSTDKRIVASSHDELVGQGIPKDYLPFYEPCMEGQVVVSAPYPSTITLPDSQGHLRAGVPTMMVAAPVRDDAHKVIAVIALRIPPEVDFTRILRVAQAGETGETYALSRSGVFLSESRFDDQLRDIGLIPDREGSNSIFDLQARNPGVDMTLGQRPTLRRGEQPLTVPAAAVAEEKSGVDIHGYLDYRGVPTIGAWAWLPEQGFGVVTEFDKAEALRPLRAVQMAFWCLLGLLLLASTAIFAYTVLVARLQRTARNATLEAKRLGQYVLEKKIGAGGMGSVYCAHHAMLRRPTAVKLIDPEHTTPATISRFEREVKLTSQLNHPNTIAIYDFGRTPEGVFYYAMELLDGLTLQALIERFGAQPEQRVVNILRQVCGSLAEAHGAGLIHRDIKPANIMVNARGGMFDVVKLLDFGLVKALGTKTQSTMTMAHGLTGTPLYMSPEAIAEARLVDARSDLYALGAVGYYLLTGTPVFEGNTIVEVCMAHVDATPEPPSVRLRKPVSAGLEDALLKCLAKNQDDRPQSARELLKLLDACQLRATWSDADAEAWWRSYKDIALQTTAALPTHSGEGEATVDISN